MKWQTLKSETVFENDWMRVNDDWVENPRGSENAYGWVHFKNRAIAVLPLDEKGNTWLVGQQRYTLDQYSWELPMGGATADEPSLDAAKRELREETGLVASELNPILRLHPSNSITDEIAEVFVAYGLTEQAADPDATEVLQVKKLPLPEAIGMAQRGEITDAISVAALFHVGMLVASAQPAR